MERMNAGKKPPSSQTPAGPRPVQKSDGVIAQLMILLRALPAPATGASLGYLRSA